MRKIFPGAVNANSNIPEKCFRMMLLKKKLLELLEDSTDIFINTSWSTDTKLGFMKILLINSVMNRSSSDIDWNKRTENFSQHDTVVDQVVEVDNASVILYPKVLKMSSGDKLRCFKVNFALQYHVTD